MMTNFEVVCTHIGQWKMEADYIIVTEPGSEQDDSIMTDHLLLQTLETRQLHGVTWGHEDTDIG